MIFVLIAWTVLLLNLILIRVWMQSPAIHSLWPRVRNTSSALLTVSAFFFLLHFTSPKQEKEMQDSLFERHETLRNELLGRELGKKLGKEHLHSTNNESTSTSQTAGRDNTTHFSLNNTIIHDIMQARLGI